MAYPPWRVPLPDLTLDTLREFFADVGGEEGTTWEAKGTTLIPNREIRRHACGFANSDGGFLILGVSERDGGWEVDGLNFPDREPAKWVCDVARAGLAPAPTVDARAFEIPNGRQVLVLEVETVDAPPCLVDGRAYQRVTGATIPVKDPRVMADLITRGRGRRDAATAAVEDAARSGSQRWRYPGERERLAVAVAPLSVPADWRRRVYTREIVRLAVDAVAGERLHSRHLTASVEDHFADGVRYTTEIRTGPVGVVWEIGCWEDGTVCASVEVDGVSWAADFAPRIRTVWDAARLMAGSCGLTGPGVAAVAVHTQGGEKGQVQPAGPLGWDPADVAAAPTDPQVDQVTRQILRAGGHTAYEPG